MGRRFGLADSSQLYCIQYLPVSSANHTGEDNKSHHHRYELAICKVKVRDKSRDKGHVALIVFSPKGFDAAKLYQQYRRSNLATMASGRSLAVPDPGLLTKIQVAISHEDPVGCQLYRL